MTTAPRLAPESDRAPEIQEASQAIPVSVVIICKNEVEVIADTLAGLARFDEVLVYDNGSSDGTQAICRSFSNVRVEEGDFFGFGPTKAHACGLAKHNWVLSLDADERISEELLTAIADWDFSQTQKVGEVRRDNQLMGKTIRYGGWGKDFLVRLFNTQAFNFNKEMVHEAVAWQGGSKQRLPGFITHQAYDNLGELLVKMNSYSDIRVKSGQVKVIPLPFIVLKSSITFIRNYFLRLGFFDGWRGFVIAYAQSVNVFFKYIKPYAQAKCEQSSS